MSQFERATLKYWVALFMVLSFQGLLQADPIRLSFLNDTTALEQTLTFLRKTGCENDSIAAFDKAIKQYYSTPPIIDFRKFPEQKDGYYSFTNMPQLLAAVPPGLCKIPHPFEFNCFDAAIVLANDHLRSNLNPEADLGTFLPTIIAENGMMVYTHARTAKEAFNLCYPSWYQNASSNCIPPSVANARMNLTAAFYCFHRLPAPTNQESLDKEVLQTLCTSWNNQKISFPSNFEIVLCHQVDLANNLIATDHAGLLFQTKNGFVYIEKDGGRGPFIRLDFGDKADLIAWLAWPYAEANGEIVYATFNNDKIEKLYPKL